MDYRMKYILKKSIINYLFNTGLKETVKRTNTLLNNYNTYNYVCAVKPAIICVDGLIYSNVLDLKKYVYYRFDDFKKQIIEFILTRELEDMEFIINYCLGGAIC